MSIESELETLFVRITVDTSGILTSSFTTEVEKIGKVIKDTIEKAAVVDFHFDFKNLKKNLEYARADLASFRLFAVGIVREINEMTLGIGAEGMDKFSDAAVFALNKVKSAVQGTRLGTEELTPLNQFLTNIKNFGEIARNRMQLAAEAVVTFRKQVSGISAAPGIDAFRSQIADLNREIKALRIVGSNIRLSLPGAAQFIQQVQDIKTQLDSIALTKIVTLQMGPVTGLQAFVRQMVLANSQLGAMNSMPRLIVAARAIQATHQMMAAITPLPSVVAFASNLKRASDIMIQFGAMPQLNTLATNSNNAALGMAKLNKELTIYSSLMTGIGRRIPRVPGVSTGGGGGGSGISGSGAIGGRNNAFGFDPVRRFLAVGTSIATGAAIGFLGFELMRQVTGFDQNMTNALSLRRDSTSGVQRTAENDVLALSRRVATGPRELAEAYRELTAAGYGTAHSLEALAVVEQFAFVGAMEASKATRELVGIQRQLGLVSNNAVENANNLRHIADVITHVGLVSGMSLETFTNGLERLTPHIRFLNRGLEDSVALLAAFGRIDSSTAVSRSQAILRGITSQFIRSETEGGSLRLGGIQHDPIGEHFRRFNPGAGVHPLHADMEAVRIAAREWRAAGIEPFFRQGPNTGQFVGVAEVVRQIDSVTRNMSALQREDLLGRLFPGQLRSTATDAIRALLSSSEAMEQFYLAARNADGVLREVANVRLQTFNAQVSILRNNLFVIAIEIGRILAPALREINNLLIAGLDAWWELGGAARMTILSFVGVSLTLISLRFLVPVVIGLFRVLFWDTIVAGVNVAASALRLFVLVVNFVDGSVRAVLSTITALATFGFQALVSGAILAYRIVTLLVSAIAYLTRSFSVLGTIVYVAEMIITGFAYALLGVENAIIGVSSLFRGIAAFAVLLQTAAVAKLTVAYLFLTSATAIYTAAQSVAVFAANAFSLSVIGVLASVLVLVGAIGVLNSVLAVLVSLLGALIASFFTLAGMAIIGTLTLIVGAITLLVDSLRGVDWSTLWDRFTNAADRAFWRVVGFVSNLQHNMQVLGEWMNTNFPVIANNFQAVMGTVSANISENITLSLARVELSIINMINRIFTGLNSATPVLEAMGIMRPGRGNLSTIPLLSATHLLRGMEPGEARRASISAADAAWRRAVMDFQARNPILAGVHSESEMIRISRERSAFADAAYRRVLEDETSHRMRGPAMRDFRGLTEGMPATMPLGSFPFGQLRFEVPDEIREAINSIFSRPNAPGVANDLARAADRVGDTFREISLNRFVLEGEAPAADDLQRRELAELERHTALLEAIHAATEAAAQGAWRVVP